MGTGQFAAGCDRVTDLILAVKAFLSQFNSSKLVNGSVPALQIRGTSFEF